MTAARNQTDPGSLPDQHPLPGTGSEIEPGEDNITSKTVQRVSPAPTGQTPEEKAADAWTGQYPEPER